MFTCRRNVDMTRLRHHEGVDCMLCMDSSLFFFPSQTWFDFLWAKYGDPSEFFPSQTWFDFLWANHGEDLDGAASFPPPFLSFFLFFFFSFFLSACRFAGWGILFKVIISFTDICSVSMNLACRPQYQMRWPGFVPWRILRLDMDTLCVCRRIRDHSEYCCWRAAAQLWSF